MNSDDNFIEKVKHLHLVQPNEDILNRLFFSARNTSIDKALYFVRQHFNNLGYKVKTSWEESSFGSSANFSITLIEKKNDFKYPFTISRESFKSSLPSELVYTAQPGTGLYMPYKMSDVHVAFLNELRSDDFFKLLTKLISEINYPFNGDVFKSKLSSVNLDDNTICLLFGVSKENSKYTCALAIQDRFDKLDMDVNVTFDSDQFKINLNKPNSEFTVFTEFYSIDKHTKFNNIVYSLDKINQTYNVKSKSKKFTEFENEMISEDFKQFVYRAINGINFPFKYGRNSSF